MMDRGVIKYLTNHQLVITRVFESVPIKLMTILSLDVSLNLRKVSHDKSEENIY